MSWTRLGVVVVMLLSAAPVRAENGAIVVYGRAKAHDREVVASALVQLLRTSSWVVADAPMSVKESDAIVACIPLDRPWPCVAPTIGDKGFDRIVVVDVEPGAAPADKDLVLTGQILSVGNAVPSADRGWCERCSDAALVSSTGELVRLMLQHAVERNPRATLVIHTVPDGAAITLDGQMIGSSNRTIDTAAGPHTVLLQRSGYRNEDRSVVTENGKTTTVEVKLVAAEPGVATTATPEHHSRLLPAALIVGGLVALVGGAVVSYETDPPNTPAQPQYLYNGPAIGVSVAGGLIVATGVYLWFHHTRSTPVVAPTQGGGIVGWATGF